MGVSCKGVDLGNSVDFSTKIGVKRLTLVLLFSISATMLCAYWCIPVCAAESDRIPLPGQSTSEPAIPVRKIVFTGSTVFTEAQLNQLSAPLLNRSVTLAEIQELASKITKLYQEQGYITSRAVVPADQNINDGEIAIQVIEGKLERIDIKRDESGRLSENYIRDRIAQAVTVPLNFARIEDELQLLRSDPVIADIKANLSAGEGSGNSILEVTYKEAKLFNLGAQFDTYGNPSTGIYRFGVTPQLINPLGVGDRLLGNYTRSSNADSFSADYQLPINPKGGTLGLSFSFGKNSATVPALNNLATIDIGTDFLIYEFSYRQPLARTSREEFALSFGLAIEQSNSFFDGIPINFQTFKLDDGRSQSSIIRFGQDFISRDPGGGWAFRSVFNLGVDAIGATIRNNAPDGRFFSWNGQILRVQRLGSDRDTLALLRFSAQLTGDALLPLNRFSTGGPQSVRGYRQNQITGDSGFQGSLEFQLPMARDTEGNSILKLLPFIEAGTVWNTTGAETGQPQSQSIVGIGTGLLWQPSRNFSIRIDYGIPLIKFNNPSNTLQDSGLYFSLSTNL
jgi:hemolysin activation/secretion protein